MTEQTEATEADLATRTEEVTRRVANMLRGMGTNLFAFLNAIPIEHRILCVGILREYTPLDGQSALLLVVDPLGVGAVIESVPLLGDIINDEAAKIDTPRDREGLEALLADAQALQRDRAAARHQGEEARDRLYEALRGDRDEQEHGTFVVDLPGPATEEGELSPLAEWERNLLAGNDTEQATNSGPDETGDESR